MVGLMQAELAKFRLVGWGGRRGEEEEGGERWCVCT